MNNDESPSFQVNSVNSAYFFQMTSRRLLKFEVPRLMPLENTLLSECPEDASSIPSLLEILNNIVCSAKLNSADMILSQLVIFILFSLLVC